MFAGLSLAALMTVATPALAQPVAGARDCSPIERIWYAITLRDGICTPPSPNPGPPPPPPPYLPPPPPMAAQPGPFLVYFDWDSSAITAEAALLLDNAARQYASTGGASIVIAGHADASGAAAYNIGLSQRRADAVKDRLAALGLPANAIVTESYGESRLMVVTSDGVPEPQNRRVEIVFGKPGS
ncbi:OmpA family protein [Sandarakinorhabdus sp. DWP1-3-1]|uniref:OmpA family protein n=1 Tax=Sandarakinorhabdus sp. DWP1-3-1 TaxID=2804627 RepID=UPI003CFAE2DF